MCQYKSAIVLPSGDLVHSEVTDSHEHLIVLAGLSDTGRQPNFVRVEFTGPDLGDIATYALKVDQDWLPPWWTPEMVEDVTRRLRGLCERAIIADARKILLGGVWVLVKDAKVDTAVSARIISMRDSSQVGTMRDSSRVGTMRDSSRIVLMRDSSQVGTMRDSSRVGTMRDSSRVGTMWGSSQVGTMWDSSQVGTMWDSSQVGTMRDSSQVGTMRESSQVGEMGPNAKAPRPPKRGGQ